MTESFYPPSSPDLRAPPPKNGLPERDNPTGAAKWKGPGSGGGAHEGRRSAAGGGEGKRRAAEGPSVVVCVMTAALPLPFRQL